MKIKSKLFTVFIGIFLLGITGAGFHLYRDMVRSKENTLTNIERIAQTIAFFISGGKEETNISAIHINPIELQKYVEDLHEIKNLHLAIVDVHKKILADVIPKNVGTVFNYDQGNEVGQTIKDGETRSFIEKHPDHPEGIQSIVIPLKTQKGETRGAVILEYGPVLDEALIKAKKTVVIVGIIFLILMPLILGLGYIFSSAIINPVITLKKTADEIADGNLDARVDLKTKDEINDLAVSFNKMTEELVMHRNQLQDLVKARTSELRKVNEELQHEITKHKQAEEEINQNLSLLNATLESTADGILVVNRGGKIEKFNQKFIQMWRIPESVIASRDDDQALSFVLDQLKDPQTFLTKVRELYDQPAAESFDILEFKDGRVFERYSQLQRIGNQSVGRVWSFRDITNRNRAEAALRESEDRYRDLVEYSQFLICTHDLKGRILSMNQGAAKVLGYDYSDILNKNLRDFLAPEVSDQFDTYLATIQKGGAATGLMMVQTAKGEKRIWEYNNTLRTKGVPEPIVRGMAHDITERKQTEQTLIRSEEAAKRLSQENETIAEIGRIISSTLNIEEIYGRFAEEAKKLIPFDRIVINTIDIEKGTVLNVYMAGQGITDREVGEIYSLEGSGNAEMVCTKSSLLIQTEDFEEYKDRFPMLLSTFQAGFRSIMNVPLFLKGKIIGGLLLRSFKPYAYTGNDVRLAEKIGNQIAGAITNAQLFIERKQAEEALRQSEEKYRTILENIEDGYLELDLAGNFTFVNDAECRNLGYTKEELIGMSNRQYTDETTARKLYQIFNRVYRTGEPVKVLDVEVIRKDGIKVVNAISVSLIRDSEGKPIGFRGISRDITERKRTEEEKEKLILQLQKALAEVKQLSGLFPICASCKKIRDDKGYWNQIEKYITDHSEAVFSHGLCPECMKKLYPDI